MKTPSSKQKAQHKWFWTKGRIIGTIRNVKTLMRELGVEREGYLEMLDTLKVEMEIANEERAIARGVKLR